MLERLSPLDGSFLRVETSNAHMHVAWAALLEPAADRPRPTLEALRRSLVARLENTPRFRRRLSSPPPGMGEPFWVDDCSFAIERHVSILSDSDDRPDEAGFARLCDRALSEPLARDRPLWHVYLVPALADGRMGLVAKIHHALVDGKSAVEVAMLLFDVTPDADPAPAPRWRPGPVPGTARLAIGALASGAAESLRAARGVARIAGAPRAGSARLYGTFRRAAMSVGDDLLRPAPSSFLNVPIGPDRTLVRFRAPFDDVKAIKRATGTTVNDVCLATVAGALRETELGRGEHPRPLRAMVPVSLRSDAERTSLGNRISLVFVDLPTQLSSPGARLAKVHADTQAFKDSGKAEGAETVFGALGLLPDMLRTGAARMIGSKRVYNLTVSNIPGPSFPLYALGAEVQGAWPVVPLAEDHALSIGIFSYRDYLHFGLYADPHALPDVEMLPQALGVALAALSRSARRGGSRSGDGRYADELLRSTNSAQPALAGSSSNA
jgi:WS/DGAT/MGAT family acyltransferase